MQAQRYVERVLEDEGLANGLDEAEAMTLIESIVAKVESTVAAAQNEAEADARVAAVTAAGRSVARIVAAWQDGGPTRAAAVAKERGLPIPPSGTRSASELLDWLLKQPQVR